MLSDMADWRYRAEPERTAWYPTMRLFRQVEGQPWAEVAARVAAELTKAATGEHPKPG